MWQTRKHGCIDAVRHATNTKEPKKIQSTRWHKHRKGKWYRWYPISNPLLSASATLVFVVFPLVVLVVEDLSAGVCEAFGFSVLPLVPPAEALFGRVG